MGASGLIVAWAAWAAGAGPAGSVGDAVPVASAAAAALLPAASAIAGDTITVVPAVRQGRQAAGAPAPGDAPGPPGSSPAAVPPWSQGVDYRIEARLDETTDVLSGHARIRYRNQSPDTLREVYLHQYLNAFRPHSLWAREDLERGIRTFQDLGPDEHAFERLREARVRGRETLPSYPYAPDSTIVRLPLDGPLLPGDSLVLELAWDARLSTVPRRQGRRGRQYDFAQWYPRVVVYDLEGWRDHPLYRQGEFYGEYATYDVTLEVRSDQVLGSTGVPVSGDPGWEGAAVAGTGQIEYRRDWYGSSGGAPCVEVDGIRVCGVVPRRSLRPEESLGFLSPEAGAGMKRVRWYAEDVHHFAWSTSPDYIYEGARWEDVSIHVLYRPGDEGSWGDGIAVERTAVALEWLERIFGDYAYPQVTNLHRIEGGGTEFPMVVMDGSASQGLILHEVGHIYAHGILGNNEWYEGWLDEGMSSFQTAWFFEEQGAGRQQWLASELSVLDLELRGLTWPVTFVAEDYPEYSIYSAMIYTKGSLVLRMLRDMVGDEAMVRVLRTYYERHALGHVDEDAFQAVAEEVLRLDLDWFFGQWLHGTGVVNYVLEDVSVEREGAGWVSRFGVARDGDLVMPVTVRLSGSGAATDTVVAGTRARQEVAVRTPFRPDRIDLDPDGTILDWNALDDVWERGLFATPALDLELDRPWRAVPVSRERRVSRWLPILWYNDAAGLVVGVQERGQYMGFLERRVVRAGLAGIEAEGSRDRSGLSVYARVENPIEPGGPAFGTRGEILLGEGRVFLHGTAERDVSRLPLSGTRTLLQGWGTLSGVYDTLFLRPGRWSDGEDLTAEAGTGVRIEHPLAEDGSLGAALGGAFGFSTRDERYVRGTLTVEVARALGSGWSGSARLFGAAAGGWVDGEVRDGEAPLERRIFLAGGDPWEAAGNPWVRSRGAPLEQEGHVPGGGTVRGFDPGLAAERLAALNLELAAPPAEVGPLTVGLSAFGDLGVASDLQDGEAPLPEGVDGAAVEDAGTVLWDAGLGVSVGWADSPIRLRVDVPFLVSAPGLARMAREEEVGFRVAVRVVGY